MPNTTRPINRTATELLAFYDDLTVLHASISFVLNALATAVRESGGNTRQSDGASFCVEWLDDRMRETNDRLKSIRSRIPSKR